QTRRALYIEHCRGMKIAILPPDVNESEADFTVHLDSDTGQFDAVRFGLAAIKNVSRNAIDAILRARADGPFTSLGDFARRVYGRAECAGAPPGATLTRPVVERLIKAGPLDSIWPHRGAPLAGVVRA